MTCDCPPADPPSRTGFLAFVRDSMGITTAMLPDGSAWITLAYCTAKALVIASLAEVDPFLYAQAVYNLAGSTLLNVAQDPSGAPAYPPGSDTKFFAYTRKSLNLLGFVGGVVQAAADEATSESMVVPDAFKGLTLANLQQIKDPYGRYYLALVQDYGPAVWGLS